MKLKLCTFAELSSSVIEVDRLDTQLHYNLRRVHSTQGPAVRLSWETNII